MTKKYFIVGFLSFLSIVMGNLAYVFKPLFYGDIYYGQLNDMFFYGINAIILIVTLILVKKVIIKKLGVTYEKVDGELSFKAANIIMLVTICTIFLVSALIGFQVKIFYDLGEGFTGTEICAHIAKIVFYIVFVLHAVVMIENFQYGLENIIVFKKDVLKNNIPLGGILTMLTLGTYSLIIGINPNLPILYFFLYLIYGWLYLISNRSYLKTYVPSIFIYLL